MLTLHAHANVPLSSARTWTPFHHPEFQHWNVNKNYGEGGCKLPQNSVLLSIVFNYKTSNASHCIDIQIYGIFELGPHYELLKRIVIGVVLSPTDELWHGFESWLATMVIGKRRDLKILCCVNQYWKME